MSPADIQALERDLAHVLNTHSCENATGTPDFVLAHYLRLCLEAWTAAHTQRRDWYAAPGAEVGASGFSKAFEHIAQEQAEANVEAVPVPTVAGWSGGGAPEGGYAKVWLCIEGREVCYVPEAAGGAT